MRIRFNNRSSFPENDFSNAVNAISQQFKEDVVPKWSHTKGHCEIVTDGHYDAVIYLIDGDENAHSLGFHNKEKHSTPAGVVFVKEIQKFYKNTDGDFSVSCVMSHEAIEIYCDPCANLWIRKNDGKFIAYEAVDPVEGYSYVIDGISVSNFVFPDWFDENTKATEFDKLLKTKKPLTVSDRGRLLMLHPSNGTARHVYGAKNERRLQARRSPDSILRTLF